MPNIQMPNVAGMFYPADPATLKQDVDQMLAQATRTVQAPPKAVIAPHAGYIYSGPVAASAYAQLRPWATQIHRVVLLAPSHRVPFSGLAVPSADSFRTPLGDVPVARAAVQEALALPQVQEFDAAFRGEHALEVQLPFLQEALESFELVPFIVGDAAPEQVAEVLELLWGDEQTLFAVSSDLSHYLDYRSARQRDLRTTQAIEALDPTRVGYHDACSRNPVNGLLLVARNHGLHARTLDLRNSGDTAGPRDQVVGYGAYVFQ